jgi:hypothetical protein
MVDRYGELIYLIQFTAATRKLGAAQTAVAALPSSPSAMAAGPSFTAPFRTTVKRSGNAVLRAWIKVTVLKGGKEGERGDWKGVEHPKTRALYFLCDEFPFLHSLFVTLLHPPLGAPSWKCDVKPNLKW